MWASRLSKPYGPSSKGRSSGFGVFTVRLLSSECDTPCGPPLCYLQTTTLGRGPLGKPCPPPAGAVVAETPFAEDAGAVSRRSDPGEGVFLFVSRQAAKSAKAERS